MANERFTTQIHVPPTEESAPAFLSVQPRSIHSVYITKRWAASRSEALRALQSVDQEKGREQSVAILVRTKTQIIRLYRQPTV